MSESNKTYRIRTVVGNGAQASVNVNLNQTYDIIDVLSLEITQKNFYKMPSAGYGAIVGRVIANGGFGIPNAKVSVFIPYEENSLEEGLDYLYHYTSPISKNRDGIRYNLLPRHLDEECHQNIGSMYEKEYMLDNNDLIQVFDKYYKYTAVTNNAGDYFIYGVPIGTQTVHVDLDLSDIGVLSQRPRDMVYKGYNINQFESPNKFKKDTNLSSLVQVYSQDRVVNVYPFWGDTTENDTNGTITRCDINIDYKFEPTCVFMGSIVSDTGNRSISQRCVPDNEIGKMSELVTGEGKIEMIRKTFDGKVEQFSVKGNALIDGDGVWCYQIPMNLDYVMTDEYGNMVPTDDPSKGIPTRARVRFRIGMNEIESDDTARKRARFLVPNNPKLNSDYPSFNETHEADYEFGTFTKEESYRDLFWNKVYTVKSYIPRLQKAKNMGRRSYTGIKNINHAGRNNPFPFNNLFIRLTFTYRFLCTLMTLFCSFIYAINTVLGGIGWVLYYLGKAFHLLHESTIVWVLGGSAASERAAYYCLRTAENLPIKLENFCDDGSSNQVVYVPMGSFLGLNWNNLFSKENGEYKYGITLDNCDECLPEGVATYSFPSENAKNYSSNLGNLFNCVENQLAQDQECTSFNFQNDWVNGVLYAPLWYRKVKPKKKIFFGLFERKAKDKWCNGDSTKFAGGLSLCQTCAQKRVVGDIKISPITMSEINPSLTNVNESNCYGYKCHKKTISFITLNKGLIISKETMYGENVYYYKSVEYDNETLRNQSNPTENGDIKMLFATDIVLLGSLDSCDIDGIPQFFKNLEGTTYNMPPDLVFMDYNSDPEKLKEETKGEEDSSISERMNNMGIGDELSSIPDDIDESSAINKNTLHTNRTGADWGNFGKDQVNPNALDGFFENEYTLTSKDEIPDIGGLFYGLTCWSSYTKPKSCVNLSRICEYGVSLDEMQEYPDYNTYDGEDFMYKPAMPDGFISYDELYDKDGRAMFATMNGNNLRTKTNPKNGFPIYDFMYLYPENFDGTLLNLMRDANLAYPMSGNFNVENNSEAYIRFRYGRNRDDSKVIQYYDSTIPLGFYAREEDRENKNRFPKFENSFYFYFGLIPGNTAIDKFRTLYYSECKDDTKAQSSIIVEFKGNTWCSEVSQNGRMQAGDGWLSIDATYVESPYTIQVTNLSGDTEYDFETTEPISEPKVVITLRSMSDLEEEYPGKFDEYVILTDEGGNQCGFLSGNYRLKITDANGEEYIQYIDFSQTKIRADIDMAAFRMTNEQLESDSRFNDGDLYENIASYGCESGEDMSTRDIGGFIKITNVAQDDNRIIDFAIDVVPIDKLYRYKKIVSGTADMAQEYESQRGTMSLSTSYEGSVVEIHKDAPTHDIVVCYDVSSKKTLIRPRNAAIPPYCPFTYDCPQYTGEDVDSNYFPTNGGRYDIRIGVPKGGVDYRVTITMLCKFGSVYQKTRNSISTIIRVPEPINFKMMINGTDYSVIKYFFTGWVTGQQFPTSYEPSIIGVQSVVGWNVMDEIDGLKTLAYLEDGSQEDYEYIKRAELILSGSPYDHDYASMIMDELGYTLKSKYNWNNQYVFNADDAITGIEDFRRVPEVRQSESVGVIRVFDSNDRKYYYYVWDSDEDEYVYLNGEKNEVISLEDYFNNCSVDAKNSIIFILNNIIELRRNFAGQAKESFTKHTTDDFTLSVTAVTYETPVKTLMYYSPDFEDGTSTQTELLDENYEINKCYGITVPTLAGTIIEENGDGVDYNNDNFTEMGRMTFVPIKKIKTIIPGGGQGSVTLYKKPFLTAIKNIVLETIPEGFDFHHTPSSTNNPFGVHVLRKGISLHYNAWACAYNWAFFYDVNTYGSNSDANGHFGEFFTIPGVVAGFILDGAPSSYEEDGNILKTNFEVQSVSEPIGIHTWTYDIDSETNEKIANDSALPTVRVIYNQYSDIHTTDAYSHSSHGYLVHNGIIPETKLQYVLITNDTQTLTLEDKYDSLSISVNMKIEPVADLYYEPYDNVVTQETKEYHRGLLKVYSESNAAYGFCFDAENPIYKKVYNSNLEHTVYRFTSDNQQNHTIMLGNNGVESIDFNDVGYLFFMRFDEHLVVNHEDFSRDEYNMVNDDKITYPSDPEHGYPTYQRGSNTKSTAFVVSISEDNSRMAVSKTFDIKRMECIYVQDNNMTTFYINLGATGNRCYQYLEYFDFRVEIEGYHSYNPQVKETIFDEVCNLLRQSGSIEANISTSLTGTVNCDCFKIQIDDVISGPDVYVTDITGLRHRCEVMKDFNNDNYKSCLTSII